MPPSPPTHSPVVSVGVAGAEAVAAEVADSTSAIVDAAIAARITAIVDRRHQLIVAAATHRTAPLASLTPLSLASPWSATAAAILPPSLPPPCTPTVAEIAAVVPIIALVNLLLLLVIIVYIIACGIVIIGGAVVVDSRVLASPCPRRRPVSCATFYCKTKCSKNICIKYLFAISKIWQNITKNALHVTVSSWPLAAAGGNVCVVSTISSDIVGAVVVSRGVSSSKNVCVISLYKVITITITSNQFQVQFILCTNFFII